jgi:predicted anti-sigma-YlaC factor YlaD
MPSEPRIPTEPTLEELSAYLDHELDDVATARVAEHVAGCAACQGQLDGLRQTAYAIRALPMETPPRTFTIPAKRRESFRWAPVAGWIGGVAAATLIIVVGVQHLPFRGPATTASGGTAMQYNAAPAARPAAPLGQGTNDALSASKSLANAVTVSDPRNPSRTLTLSTDASVYSPTGVMAVQIRIAGLAAQEISQPRVLLERNGYAIELATPTHPVPSTFQVTYDLSRLPLASPASGSYTLILIESLPASGSGSGSTLVARLPITIQG